MRLTLLAFVFALSCRIAEAQDAPSAQVATAPQDAPATQAAKRVRCEPADLLTDLRDDGSLLKGLEDPSPEVRWVAARGLARLAEANAIPAIAARVAQEPDSDVLAELIFALGQRGQADAAAAGPALLALLNHDLPAIRAAAVAAVVRLNDDGVTADVVALLNDASPEVRGAAALALFRLDGRRYDHPRTVEAQRLDARDGLLNAAAVSDSDAGVRWRATYAMAGLRGRAELARLLSTSWTSGWREPLARLFALRGIRALEGDGLIDTASLRLDTGLADGDERVAIECARALSLSGSCEALAGSFRGGRSALLRYSAAAALRERLARPDIDDAARAEWCESLQDVAIKDDSAMVRREVAALIVALAPADHALYDLYLLAGSDDRRDRERAAKELAARDPPLDAQGLIERLLHDEPAVAAEALAAPAPPDVRTARLVEALGATDAALVATAAEQAMKPAHAGSGTESKPVVPTEPWLVAALKAAHEHAVGPEMKEARAALRKALGLAPDTAPPAAAQRGGTPDPLLDRLLAEHRAALDDPSPRVRLQTSKGLILLELDRVNAPRHVASFLELAASGFYDGLDFHRVVPNFVVQGLDPRGDGYGTGGRRLPDEFSPRHFEAGTLGMPNAGEPHTGGCQIFITHIPTPHLDGNYTVFGKVVEGMDVVQQLEIGDTVTYVRLAPDFGIPDDVMQQLRSQEIDLGPAHSETGKPKR